MESLSVTDSALKNERNTEVYHFASSALNFKILIFPLQVLVYLNCPIICECIDEEITAPSWLK